MAFLRPSLVQEPVPLVRGAGLCLRPPLASDFAAWAALRAASRMHLMPFEPQWSHDELSRSAFRQRLRRYQSDLKDDLGYALFMVRDTDNELLGGITLSNVRRGVTQAAALGYWIGASHARQGYMRKALSVLMPYAFEGLRLHRIEAACLPHNTASMRVLEGAGFQKEGLARRYLKINGTWQDHVLYALIEGDQAR
jgi:[ribosomal protein S5]-alanine N-acetyltransferase